MGRRLKTYLITVHTLTVWLRGSRRCFWSRHMHDGFGPSRHMYRTTNSRLPPNMMQRFAKITAHVLLGAPDKIIYPKEKPGARFHGVWEHICWLIILRCAYLFLHPTKIVVVWLKSILYTRCWISVLSFAKGAGKLLHWRSISIWVRKRLVDERIAV